MKYISYWVRDLIYYLRFVWFARKVPIAQLLCQTAIHFREGKKGKDNRVERHKKNARDHIFKLKVLKNYKFDLVQ